MKRIGLLALTLVIAVGGCGRDAGVSNGGTNPPSSAPTTTESNEGGFGAPSQSPGEFALGRGKPVSGVLRLADNGCWYAELADGERLVVLPHGFEQSPETGAELVDETGTTFRTGDRFDAVGSIVPGSEIPGGEDGKWGNYMAFCKPRLDELAVFDSFVHEFDPTVLSESDLAEMVRNAVFTDDWSCGRGWAISTSDQTVGLVVYESATPPSDGIDRIELPAAGWDASIMVGKNLFSEHCNDAIENWIALPTVAMRWPLSDGTITVTDPMPAQDDDPARVRAVLEGARIDTGSGSISLPRTELDNDSFNFFAG